MASKANLVIDQGATFSTDLYLTDTDGGPLLLNGYTASSQMRKWYTSANASATFATFVNVESSFITLSLAANSTGGLTAGRYVYDVEIFDGNTVSRVVEGIVTVTPQVTR
jgi:hypothetical protein